MKIKSKVFLKFKNGKKDIEVHPNNEVQLPNELKENPAFILHYSAKNIKILDESIEKDKTDKD